MDSLYSLTAEFQTLLEYADSIEPEDEQVFLDTMEGLLGNIEAKVDSYAAVMSQMEAHENMLEAEIDRLEAKRQAINNNRKRMKDAVYAAMVAMDKQKITTDLHTFSIRKAGGKQKMVITGEVPDSFQKVVYEADKERIRSALENGEALDFAHLEERGEYLRID